MSLAIAAAAIAALVARLPYGVNLTDEAFYVALPYRFWLGDRPFVDEVLVFQTAALMTEPLVAAFLALRGGTDGLMGFARWAYLGFSLAIAALVAVALARIVRWQYALPVVIG